MNNTTHNTTETETETEALDAIYGDLAPQHDSPEAIEAMLLDMAESHDSRPTMTRNKLHDLISEQRLTPGSQVHTDASDSTIRRWERRGWIRDAGTAEAPRLMWIVLTKKGYLEA